MDKQDLSRQIKDFIHALASLDDEDAQKLADCFRRLVQFKRTKEMRATNAQPDKRPGCQHLTCGYDKMPLVERLIFHRNEF